jgi:hypothetical protein
MVQKDNFVPTDFDGTFHWLLVPCNHHWCVKRLVQISTNKRHSILLWRFYMATADIAKT